MHQSIFKLIHTEDHQEFRRNLHWAFNPPQSAEGEPSPEGTCRHEMLHSPQALGKLSCSQFASLWLQIHPKHKA